MMVKKLKVFIDSLLRENLSPRGYFIFHDVRLRSKDCKSIAQIDHIAVSKYGIIVIETKDWAGEICGDSYVHHFVQYINNQMNEYYSPIKQNKKHYEVLQEVIGKYFCKSMIVFTSAKKLNIDSGHYMWVGMSQGLIEEIISCERNHIPYLSESEVENIVETICSSHIGCNKVA